MKARGFEVQESMTGIISHTYRKSPSQYYYNDNRSRSRGGSRAPRDSALRCIDGTPAGMDRSEKKPESEANSLRKLRSICI
jgi:hypothetical protein